MTPLLTGLDYPDPDVIRVDDTYYMVSTTMHFLPGASLLRSFDLVHWEPWGTVFDTLEDDAAHRLEDGQGIYGKGMWAASLRHHGGEFFVCFVANETRKTYLFRSRSLAGPWQRSEIGGFYHDPSLLFDGERVFLAWGNTEIRITELKGDLSRPLPGGLDRVAVRETGNRVLGYEGCHFYRIDGRYYLFLIHSLPFRWRRVQACFWSDTLEGEFRGGDVLDDDLGYGNNGVAQGGVVDTPDGRWFAVLFQDRGAVGRIPVLVPITWDGPQPLFGVGGRVDPAETTSTRPEHRYAPLVGGDDFRGPLAPFWQWNHNPDPAAWRVDPTRGQLRLRSVQTAATLAAARNTLTQRMAFPWCAADVTLDGRDLQVGDQLGLAALQSAYGAIALHCTATGYELVTLHRSLNDPGPGGITTRLAWDGPEVRVRVEASFSAEHDEARLWYLADEWRPLGPVHRLAFRLDHFVGCRFALFLLSPKTAGGEGGFGDFRYHRESP